MRKVIIFNLLALFVASAAFAADPGAQNQASFASGKTGLSLFGAAGAPSVTGGVPAAGTILIGKNSTGCSVGWDTATGGYAINTQHQNGSKAFGTSFDSTAIYQVDVVKGTAVAQPGATDSSAFPSSANWTTM
jgi:hypothetical protein